MVDLSSPKTAGGTQASNASSSSLARWLPGRDRMLGVSTIAAFIVIWEIIYRLGLMPVWAFSSPGKGGLAFQELIRNSKLLTDTAASVRRPHTAVILSALLGLPAGRWR